MFCSLTNHTTGLHQQKFSLFVKDIMHLIILIQSSFLTKKCSNHLKKEFQVLAVTNFCQISEARFVLFVNDSVVGFFSLILLFSWSIKENTGGMGMRMVCHWLQNLVVWMNSCNPQNLWLSWSNTLRLNLTESLIGKILWAIVLLILRFIIFRYSHHPATTNEIKALCEDLKVLGKIDFQRLLKWRTIIRTEEVCFNCFFPPRIVY
jgi:hypothetical protein